MHLQPRESTQLSTGNVSWSHGLFGRIVYGALAQVVEAFAKTADPELQFRGLASVRRMTEQGRVQTALLE